MLFARKHCYKSLNKHFENFMDSFLKQRVIQNQSNIYDGVVCENKQRLKVVKLFPEKAPAQIFDPKYTIEMYKTIVIM